MYLIISLLVIASGVAQGNVMHKYDEDCSAYPNELQNPTQKTSFYVKCDEGVERVSLNLKTPQKVIISLVAEVFPKDVNWINVSIVADGSTLKVMLEKRVVATVLLDSEAPFFTLESVELRGNGLLTWCKPTLITNAIDYTEVSYTEGQAIALVLLIISCLVLVTVGSLLIAIQVMRCRNRGEKGYLIEEENQRETQDKVQLVMPAQ